MTVRWKGTIHASGATAFRGCPAKYGFRYVLRVVRKAPEEGSDNLAWGTLWHEAMRLRWSEQRPMEQVVEAVRGMWPSDLLQPGEDPHGRDVERMVALLHRYEAEFAEQEATEIVPVQGELEFDIECPQGSESCPLRPGEGCDLRWSGRLDRLVRWRGRLYVWDYKTTGRLSEVFWDHHRYGWQLRGYLWAASHLAGEKVRRAALDVLHTLKSTANFYRRTFIFTPEEIEGWRRQARIVAAEIQDFVTRYGDRFWEWPQNLVECTNYRRCQYTDVCWSPTGRETQAAILREMYQPDETVEDTD